MAVLKGCTGSSSCCWAAAGLGALVDLAGRAVVPFMLAAMSKARELGGGRQKQENKARHGVHAVKKHQCASQPVLQCILQKNSLDTIQ